MSAAIKSEREHLNFLIGGWPTRIKDAADKKRVQELWTATMNYAQDNINHSAPDVNDLIVVADLFRMGHNVDIQGTAEECDSILKDVLKVAPENGEAHYVFAAFLVTSALGAAPLAEKHFLEAERLSIRRSIAIFIKAWHLPACIRIKTPKRLPILKSS